MTESVFTHAARLRSTLRVMGRIFAHRQVLLNDDPVLPLECATKRYVDSLPGTIVTYTVDLDAEPGADIAAVVNAHDFTGHQYATGTALDVKVNHAAKFYWNGVLYDYIGPKPQLLGLGGDYTTVVADYTASGIGDHGQLSGLGDDDHQQYHNDVRGDIRYYTQSQIDTQQGVQDQNLVDHEADKTNPHEVMYAQLTDVPTHFNPEAHAADHHIGGDDLLAHDSITGSGTNTHAQIDTHIADDAKHRLINDAGPASPTELYSSQKIAAEDALNVKKAGDTMQGALSMEDSSPVVLFDDLATPEIVGAIVGLQNSGAKELQIVADTELPGPATTASNFMRLYAAAIDLHAPQVAIAFGTPVAGDRVVIGGLNSLGHAILSLEPAPPPPYEETGTNALDVLILSGVGPGPWVTSGILLTMAQALTSGNYNITFGLQLDNRSIRTGRIAYSISLNGAALAPPSVNDYFEVGASVNEYVADNSVGLGPLGIGDTLELFFYAEGDNPGFDLWASGSINPTVFRVYELGGGGAAPITIHNDLTGRDVTDTHPQAAITGLVAALANKSDDPHGHAATEVTYDNTTSGLTAVEVQAALDEVAAGQALGVVEYAALATEDAGDSTIEGDVNATDWTGHAHAVGTALQIELNHIVTFSNGKGVAYRWVGSKPALVGVGGTYTTLATDYVATGVGDHNTMSGRDAADAHPITSITGLQAALDAKLANPVDYIDFNDGAGTPWLEGRLFWDEVEHALSYYNDDSDVTINMGQELVARVRNATGATLLNGSAVYVNGAIGNRPTVALALGNSLSTARVAGVLTHDLANNTDGYITLTGVVRGFDTSSWAAGTILYLSSTVPGALTDTQAGLGDAVAIVTVSNPTVGWMYVSPRQVVDLSAYDAHIADTDNPHEVTYAQLPDTPTSLPPSPHTHAHADTTGRTANDHHNQVHTWNGADHSGMPATFPPDPHDHDGVYEPADAAIQAHLSATNNPHGVLTGYKNILINGKCEGSGAGVVNQRGFNGLWGLLSVGEYGWDRWKKSGSAHIQQIIEGANLRNGDHVLSWIGGSTGSIIANGITVASGASPLTAVGVSWAQDDTNDSAVVPNNAEDVQLERGLVASSFEVRSYGLELALCQRYYWETDGASFGWGERAAAQVASLMTGQYIVFPVEMRVVPAANAVGMTYTNCSFNSAITSQWDFLIRVSVTGLTHYRAYGGTSTFDAEL